MANTTEKALYAMTPRRESMDDQCWDLSVARSRHYMLCNDENTVQYFYGGRLYVYKYNIYILDR